MKHESKLIDIRRNSPLRLDPTLTSEEALVLRVLAAGQTDRHLCKELHMEPTIFLRMMREMRAKVGKADNASLIEWAKERIGGLDQRIDRPERYARPT